MQALAKQLSVFAGVTELRDGLVKRGIRDIVCDKLQMLIASGVLQIGDVLPGERDLAAALGVSRETVRGAVQTLATRGILEVSHGARTRVISTEVGPITIGIGKPKALDSYDIDTVHGARLVVERQVVAEAARRIDEATLGQLQENLQAQRAADSDPVRFLICDREFHHAIYRASENPLLADFTMDLYAYMLDHRRRAVARPGAIQQSYRDHVAIVDALCEHDEPAVVAAFDAHLKRIYHTTRSIMRDDARSAAAGEGAGAGSPATGPGGANLGGLLRFTR
jgi:DNA-binding FadR family transcriptional regulator